MEIKTKLDLGHSIYFMSKNKVTSGKIISIKTIVALVIKIMNSKSQAPYQMVWYCIGVVQRHDRGR